MPSLQALVLVLQGDLQSLLAELNCCMLLEWHRRPPLGALWLQSPGGIAKWLAVLLIAAAA